MPVTLSDEHASLIHEALETAVLLDSFDEATINASLELEDRAYKAICEALGITPRSVDAMQST